MPPMEQRAPPCGRGAVGRDPMHAVVPLRSLAGGKARLERRSTPRSAKELLLGMLRRTLGLLRDWAGLQRAHGCEQDPRVLDLARESAPSRAPVRGRA